MIVSNLDEWNFPVNCKTNDKYCGKCCYNTEMPLTKHDIVRIRSLGYQQQYFVVYYDDIPHLKNVNGHCVFLDSITKACKIYDYRPLGCRLYPLVYDITSKSIIIDPECPQREHIDFSLINKFTPLLRILVKEIYGIMI